MPRRSSSRRTRRPLSSVPVTPAYFAFRPSFAQAHIAVAGDVLHFPSNIQHGATMLEEEVVLVDIFTPLREDFLAQRQAGSR